MSNTSDVSPEASDAIQTTQSAPTNLRGILSHLGPGLIVAGSIVGSGELIATTKTGAEAGFGLLWLIIIGCVIKVFVQVEFGRYTMIHGLTPMDGMAEVPGPKIKGRGNWLVWYWFVMWFASIGQLGGIVGGVGQALAISAPLTAAGRAFNEYVDAETELTVKKAERNRTTELGGAAEGALEQLDEKIQALEAKLAGSTYNPPEKVKVKDFATFIASMTSPPLDAKLWATIIAVVTAVVLVAGRYGLIQHFSTTMVGFFTLITVINLVMLQNNATWSVDLDDIVTGLSFRATAGVATALAAFGIIGVGASELVVYPYWCLEKGYARFTGKRDSSEAWAQRARGWMHVMRWDAWCSMVVYTFATVAFYLLGAAILGRTGLNPEGSEMIRMLAVMYEPVFGRSAQLLFLFGAFAVLYSTFFVANASHARTFSDALRVLGLVSGSEDSHRSRVKLLSGLFPFVCLAFYIVIPAPAFLVLVSGVAQAIMLPMLAGAGLFFRYRRIDKRVAPGFAWDVCLWISAAGMLVAGVWAFWTKISPLLLA